MPVFVPYLAITVVILIYGRRTRNNRHCRNATISFGQWTGGLLQTWNGEHWENQDSRDTWVVLDARNITHRVSRVDGERVSVIYHTPQHLHRLREEDWDILERKGFPVSHAWIVGYSHERDSDDEEEGGSDLPQEQIPTFSEGEVMVEDRIDIDSSSTLRPTLQAVLWLSELISATRLRQEPVHRRGPVYRRQDAFRTFQDINALMQTVSENSRFSTVVVVMIKILVLIISMIVRIGLQYHVGLMLVQMLLRDLWVPQEDQPEIDEELVETVTTIPVSSIWKWIPSMFWVRRLSLFKPRQG